MPYRAFQFLRMNQGLLGWRYDLACPACGHVELPQVGMNNVVWVDENNGFPAHVQKRCRMCSCLWRERTIFAQGKLLRYRLGVALAIFLAFVVGSCIISGLLTA